VVIAYKSAATVVPEEISPRPIRRPKQPVPKPPPVRQLNIGPPDVEPLVLIQRRLAMHGPSHAGSIAVGAYPDVQRPTSEPTTKEAA
jgi:hypothetical protein